MKAGTRIFIGQAVYLNEIDNRIYPMPAIEKDKHILQFVARKDYEKGDAIEFDPNELRANKRSDPE